LIGDVFEDKFSELFSAMNSLSPLPENLSYGYTVK